MTDGGGVIQSTAASQINQSGYRVGGLMGINNPSTPTSQFDLSADLVVLYNPLTEKSVVRTNTGVLTNNVSTAGPTAGGRDQAGAFSANTWLHLYFIWNGTTLSTLVSLTAPPTGPTLPSGYTHWAYAGTIFFGAFSTYVSTLFRGSMAFGLPTAVVMGGLATSQTSVSAAAGIPPNSKAGQFVFILDSNGAAACLLFAGPTGGPMVARPVVQSPAGITSVMMNTQLFPTDANQSIDYYISDASIGVGAEIDVTGYIMPNGG